MWMINNESISKTNQIHTTESIGWFNCLSILINGTGLNVELILSDIHIHLHLKSAIFDRVILKNTGIPSKCRNVEERLIFLITTTIKNQTHPIWFNDNNQFDKSIVCDLLINNRANDWLIAGLIEWRIQLDFHSNSIGFIHSSFIAVIIQFSSMFSMQWSIPIQWGKINILFQYQWLYCIIYLLINGFTNVNNHQQISIHSNHSIVSLSNPIFLIIRSNQFAINIEQILVQIIIWVWLVDWNHCHLWLFNMWSLGHR